MIASTTGQRQLPGLAPERLVFARRALRDRTATSERRTWLSTDGAYAVEEHAPHSPALPTRYLAVRVEWLDRRSRQRVTRLISRHRTRRAAERACRAHARRI